jgi:hypothetical protein
MRRFLLAIALTIFSTFASTAAAAARTIIVDVKGDIDDPDALRDAIAKELGAVAVAPDDARATQAKGTLVIEAKGADRRMTASYRRLGDAVSRTVDLPADPRRMRQFAVVLAGNVAREEADELLGAMKKPAPPPPPAPAAPAVVASEADLRRARAILDHHVDLANDRRLFAATAALAQAAACLSFGAYYVAQPGEAAATQRKLGGWLLAHGTGSLAGGVLTLALVSDPHEVLALRLRELEASSSPEDALATLDREWAEAADRARSDRKVGGGIAVGIGALGVLAGLALPMFIPRSQQDNGTMAASMGITLLGGLTVGVGINLFYSPSAIESSYSMYRAIRGGGEPSYGAWSAGRPRAQATEPRPTIGAGPMPGGGGGVSLGLVF